MRRLAPAVVWLVVCAAAPLYSQEGATADEEADVLVLDHDFTAGVGEFVRVFLQARQVYRAELSTPDVLVGLRSRISGVRLPRVYPVTDAHSASGSSVLEVYPEEDGEYELRPIARTGEGVATRLRLYRDARASQRRMAILAKPGWELGIEVAAGWHSGFDQRSFGAPGPEVGETGSDVEACFAARSAPGLDALSACALGFGWGSQHGARSVLWIYTEPRLRILGRRDEDDRSTWDVGGLFRVAMGSVERATEVPVLLAPGIYVARHIRTGLDGSGWTLRASYAYGTIRNTPKERVDGRSPTTHRVLLGVGWYR